MKRILLCTTALAGLVASSAFAGDLDVTMSGNSKFEAGTRQYNNNNSAKYPLTANQNSSAFFSTSKVSLSVVGKSDALTYGATIRLQVATNQANGTDRESRMDRSHIFLDSDFGSVQLGANVAASKLAQVTASDIASATGGVDGDYPRYLSQNVTWDNQTPNRDPSVPTTLGMFNRDLLVLCVDTLSNRKDGVTESADKITYISPRVEGTQLLVSYVPDLSNGGNSVGNGDLFGVNGTNPYYLSAANRVRVRNLWSFGLNYKNTFDEVNVELAATGDMGRSREVDGNQLNGTAYAQGNELDVRNLKTYTVGGLVGMRGFSAALSYSHDGNSAVPYETTVTNVAGSSVTVYSQDFKSSWWTSGVAYANGPMSTSLTYLSGKKGYTDYNMKSKVVSLGADYEVAPGFKPFAEVTYAKYNGNNDNLDSVKATVLILGTRVKF
jgi:outer membrane protein OmpU